LGCVGVQGKVGQQRKTYRTAARRPSTRCRRRGDSTGSAPSRAPQSPGLWRRRGALGRRRRPLRGVGVLDVLSGGAVLLDGVDVPNGAGRRGCRSAVMQRSMASLDSGCPPARCVVEGAASKAQPRRRARHRRSSGSLPRACQHSVLLPHLLFVPHLLCCLCEGARRVGIFSLNGLGEVWWRRRGK
jgi:hypothetical protein